VNYFIGIDLPQDVVKELLRIQQRIAAAGTCRATWVNPAHFHITLLFLGQRTDEEVSSVCDQLARVSEHLCSVALQKIEIPSWSPPRLIWATVGNSNLTTLHTSLITLFPSFQEQRTFKGHCTIGRLKAVSDVHALKTLLETITISALKWPVSNIKLYASYTSPIGTDYKEVASYKLLSAEEHM